MPILEDPRHEIFVRRYRATLNKTRAYADAYGYSETRPWMSVNAHRLLRSTKVARRNEELQRRMMKKSEVTIERCLTEYEEARELAKRMEQPANMLAATEKKAKIVGLLKDKQELTINPIENAASITELLDFIRDEVGEHAAEAIMAVFMATPDEDDEETDEDLTALANIEPEGRA